MRAPLSTFRGYLKQVSSADLDGAAKIVLGVAYPGFWPVDEHDESIQAQVAQLQRLQVDSIALDLKIPRRFSSCWSLPRRRYSSLSHDDIGNDDGTLINELTAYLDPSRAGLVLAGDMSVPESVAYFREHLGIDVDEGSYLVIAAVGRPGAISPVIEALGKLPEYAESARGQQHDSEIVAVAVPYSVKAVEIADVFDLRIPAAQQFLVEEYFQKDTPELSKAQREGITQFVEALPLLMHPARGGGPHAELIGVQLQGAAAFCRRQGAQALVFPSARSDTLCEVRGDELMNWRGWCLVDYREADAPMAHSGLDMSNGWYNRFPQGATIRVASGGPFAGSFEVQGMVKAGLERIGNEERAFLAKGGAA